MDQGTQFCKRDERGWRIPQEGTLSRKIYDLLCEGLPPREIKSRLAYKKSTSSLRVSIWRIKNPEAANKAGLET